MLYFITIQVGEVKILLSGVLFFYRMTQNWVTESTSDALTYICTAVLKTLHTLLYTEKHLARSCISIKSFVQFLNLKFIVSA